LDRFRPVEDRDLPDADVVVATWWLTAEWVAALAPAKGAKAYFIQHMETVFGQDVDRVHATWRLPMQKIVIAPWLADLARDQFGDPSAIVVKPGIDTELFNAPPRDKQPRPTVGFLYSPPLAFKGTRTALEVVSAVAKEVPDLLVRTFGTAALDPTAPLPPDAEFTRNPAQIALRSIYAACDVWLCSSTSEGFYLPSLEAMACRCPAVATRVGGLPAMVQEGVNGYLIDVGDTAAMADRLVKVLKSDNSDWRRMSEAAYETAMRYTWPEVTEGFERALESAIAHAAK
jgi:glycosyltransferase involved in cell wall biosynthesis